MATSPINQQPLVQNSNTIFGILSQAQKNESDLVEKVAKVSITEKLQAGKDASLGQVIDLLI